MKYCFLFILALIMMLIPVNVSAQVEKLTPKINSIVPDRAYAGDTVIMTGDGFSKDAAKNVVVFGSSHADVIKASETQLEVKVPEKVRVCNVHVEVSGDKSNEYKFYTLPYVEFKLANSNIEIGKKTQGIVRVYGSKKPWTVKLINKYYEIIDLNGGKEVTLTTSGGEDNIAKVDIMAKKKGNFNITFKVLSGYDANERVAGASSVPVKVEPKVKEPVKIQKDDAISTPKRAIKLSPEKPEIKEEKGSIEGSSGAKEIFYKNVNDF